MTIVAIWQEENALWTAADTRFASASGKPSIDAGSKIFSIPIICVQSDANGMFRVPHYWTTFGFAFAGAVVPAVMTANTAATLCGQLVSINQSQMPPRFEDVAGFVEKLASRFVNEYFQAGGKSTLFSGALFGWCPYSERYKVAHLESQIVEGGAMAVLKYQEAKEEPVPWLVLGSGKSEFAREYDKIAYGAEPRKRMPLLTIERMIAAGTGADIGGAISLGLTRPPFGFQPYYRAQPLVPGKPQARRLYNNIDVDELGPIGHHIIGGFGMA